jgi:hypothetical protein
MVVGALLRAYWLTLLPSHFTQGVPITVARIATTTLPLLGIEVGVCVRLSTCQTTMSSWSSYRLRVFIGVKVALMSTWMKMGVQITSTIVSVARILSDFQTLVAGMVKGFATLV